MTTDLRYLLAIYVHAHQTGNSVPPHIDAEARAALADEPAEPAPPADGEVAEVAAELRNFVAAYKCCHNHDHIWSISGGDLNARLTVTLINRAAELLQRQALVPVSVSERLPGPEDCDDRWRCWWWYPPIPEQTYGYWAHEDDAIPERAIDEQPTHWLPAHALPLPEAGE